MLAIQFNDFITDSRCAPLEYIGNSYATTYTADENDTAALYCNPGYRFSDGSTERQQECSIQNWSEEFENECKGTITLCYTQTLMVSACFVYCFVNIIIR